MGLLGGPASGSRRPHIFHSKRPLKSPRHRAPEFLRSPDGRRLQNSDESERNHAIARSPNAANGGAVYLNGGSHTIRRCTFERNAAQSNGALAIQSGAASTIEICRFTQNVSDVAGGAVGFAGAAASSLADCVFETNESGVGGAVYTTSSIAIARCLFADNFTHAPTNYAGALYLSSGASGSTISECDFIGNRAQTGAAIQLAGSNFSFDRCRIIGNQAVGSGGALWHVSGSATYTNCLIAKNASGFNGSVLFMQTSSTATLINCTVVDNTSPANAFYVPSNTLNLRNSIVRNPGVEFTAGTITAAHSNIEGGFAGGGNIDALPLFVDPLMNDYSLDSGSPCIDAGDSSLLAPSFPLDLVGGARFVDDPATADTGVGPSPVIDMGANEVQSTPPAPCPGDANADGIVNFDDITAVLANWGSMIPPPSTGDANSDGQVNFDDITAVLAKWGAVCP